MAVKKTQSEGNLLEAIQQFCADKSLDREAVMGVIRDSLITAYKKKSGLEGLEESEESKEPSPVTVEFASGKDSVVIAIAKKVVAGQPSSALEIGLEDAQVIDSSAEVGSVVFFREKPVELSRIISSQAKQMVFQRLKDMEKELLYNEYKAKEGELTHGYFQRWKKDAMSIDLGKVEGIMPRREQNPGEKYHGGDRLKAIIQRVELRPREPIPVITLSRASADFVRKLFEMEIPEIYDGLVEIINVARQPSIRTKVVVRATRGDIDPVGACVGMKGVRIQSIVRELGNERIDIVETSDDAAEFIANAISPAKPVEVKVDGSGREAMVVVPDDQLSLAIGINGSNVKLASQLAGYKIDIKTVAQYNAELASPEARERLERLFYSPVEEEAKVSVPQEEEELTPLEDLPGLSARIVGILKSEGIKDLETLIEYSQDDLAKLQGIGHTTAGQILKLLRESVEWVEDN
ncbi:MULTISPECIES: transcription termination factor NusA [Leptospira]|uniref:Transcription termination/antitermination protein NusA n=3 Tax=Leptospira santarosai TaxID=28183 RepID=A0AB73ML29_9LEPT|nr:MULTISPECIES: transcription termination factor NusA [Leptospira]ASV10948.1 transcription termination/antitermination protein NusA [Leptospira santarosai]AVV51021.1 Transcription termination/antitermination protein NusA [Leptospira santarosai]AVV78911.1 Transcription termination/antitermination protein NusA [Leptospira santarosai]EKR92948.1 transcription termination factor NusA [Leptospira santarosai str. CBC379]EKT88308.1 transcription elongation factor NusA [Leptospira santarosai serovar S